MSTNQFRTEAEAQTLAKIDAQLAAGEDPFGDDDDDEAPAAEAASDGPTDELPTEDTPDTDGDAPAAEAAAEGTPAEPAAEVEEEPAPTFQAAPVHELDANRTALLTQKAEAFKKFADGEMDAAEYSAKEAEILAQLEQITVARALQTANQQQAYNRQVATIDALKERAKEAEGAEKIDYDADPEAVSSFNTALQLVAKQPGNEKASFSSLADKAHKMVLALRGVQPKPAAAPSTGAKPRENGKGPLTLRGLPAASSTEANGTLKDQMARLSGQAYEQRYKSLTPAQKAALLDD